MAIGEEVKYIIEQKKDLTKRIHAKFREALQDIKSTGIQTEDQSDFGNSLIAVIGDYLIEIPYDAALEKIKSGLSRNSSILDSKIENTLNELIKSELES